MTKKKTNFTEKPSSLAKEFHAGTSRGEDVAENTC